MKGSTPEVNSENIGIDILVNLSAISDTCNYIGDSYSKLNIHKLSHSDERPIKCEHCDKGFKDKYGLQNHLKMVHLDQCPDLPLLVCETDGCKYKTKSKDSFIRHKQYT